MLTRPLRKKPRQRALYMFSDWDCGMWSRPEDVPGANFRE